MTLRLKSILAASAASIALAAAPAIADDLAIVLSPVGDPTQKKSEIVEIIKMMTQTIDPGERAVVFNGLTGRSVCDFVVPDRKSYASDKAKINANRACSGRLIKFAETVDVDGPAGALNVPASLRVIVESLDMAEIDAVIILGSPIYNDPREPSVSMLNGHVPSDGHITAARADSPYSMAGLEGRLQGTPVHFSTDGYDWALNNRYEASVHRFLWLAVETLGGPLVTFNADRAQLIDRVARGVETSFSSFERAESGKLEMIQIRRDAGRRTPIHERTLTTVALTDAERRRATDVEVGITWDCACDMDIYVRPFPEAEVIFYGNRRSNEGQFYRDYRNGRDLLNGLESVSFYAPVNLDEMVIGVNFYSGNAPEGVTGEIRIAVGERTYAMPFEISATVGNKGLGATEAFRDLVALNDRWLVTTGKAVVSNE